MCWPIAVALYSTAVLHTYWTKNIEWDTLYIRQRVMKKTSRTSRFRYTSCYNLSDSHSFDTMIITVPRGGKLTLGCVIIFLGCLEGMLLTSKTISMKTKRCFQQINECYYKGPWNVIFMCRTNVCQKDHMISWYVHSCIHGMNLLFFRHIIISSSRFLQAD